MSHAAEDERDAAPGDDHSQEAAASARRRHDGDPDLLLDVSELRVDEISLEVQDLKARVSLQAAVLDLLNLHVGVDAALGRVQLTIKGVEAQVLLKVHLHNVAGILDRVLTTIDNNPEIVERLGGAVEGVAGEAVGEIGGAAGSALDDVGRRAERAVEGVGEGVETAVDDLAEAPRRRAAGKRTEAKSDAKRRRPPEAEERPRRRTRSDSTPDRARKTSRRPRDRGSEES
jgi:hypothetical protein